MTPDRHATGRVEYAAATPDVLAELDVSAAPANAAQAGLETRAACAVAWEAG